MKLTRLDARTFDLLASKTRMSSKGKSMAAAVLVDQLPLVTVARQFGVSKQRVEDAVKRIRKVHQVLAPAAGWGTSSLEIPFILDGALSDLMGMLAAAGTGEHFQGVLSAINEVIARVKGDLGSNPQDVIQRDSTGPGG